jgi:hypothetical protein
MSVFLAIIAGSGITVASWVAFHYGFRQGYRVGFRAGCDRMRAAFLTVLESARLEFSIRAISKGSELADSIIAAFRDATRKF